MLVESDDLELLELILATLDHPLFYDNKTYVFNKYICNELGITNGYLPSNLTKWSKLYTDLKHVELRKEIDQNYSLSQL